MVEKIVEKVSFEPGMN